MVRVIPEIENVSYALGTLGMTGLVNIYFAYFHKKTLYSL